MSQKGEKTKESIEYKWEQTYKAFESKAQVTAFLQKKKLREQNTIMLDRKYQQIDRKLQAKLKRKKTDCDRKCKNEIRKLEWKEERVYKKKEKKFNKTEFVMELMQENAKLRDTDRAGRWYCISCNRLKERSELAWWHRYSRSIRCICTKVENINAQCHSCNRTTWPRGNVVAKEKCNQIYDENLDKKYWKGTAGYLYEMKRWYFQNPQSCPTDGLITDDSYIEMAIWENELRWMNKDFYKPKKKRKEIRLKYKTA